MRHFLLSIMLTLLVSGCVNLSPADDAEFICVPDRNFERQIIDGARELVFPRPATS